MSDEITTLKLTIRELEMKMERIIDHERGQRKVLDDLTTSNIDLRMSVNELLRQMKTIPDRIDDVEKKQLEKTAFDKIVNTVVILVLGMLISHFINTQVIAPRDEKKHNYEQKE
jgi:uncharacterized coiled-coil protein SlyX